MSDPFLDVAIAEARAGLAAGGIPIGSALVLDGEVVGRGHNQRVQKGSPTDPVPGPGQLSSSTYHVVWAPAAPARVNMTNTNARDSDGRQR